MADLPQSQIRMADLATRKPTAFSIVPDANARRAIAEELGIIGLKKLRFEGEITPQDRKDWGLSADLGATVVQECVVSLDPVTTRIDEKVFRTYVANFPAIEASEIEMQADETIDEIPETLDLITVLVEALLLALPPYPRIEGASIETTVFAEPGVAPMQDDDAKPFAALGALRESLENKDK